MPEKDVAQGTLKGDVEQNGDNAEGGQQAANRHIKDVGDGGGASGDIDDAAEEILQEARRAGLSFEDAGHDKREERTLSWRWLGWQDPCRRRREPTRSGAAR